MCVLRHVANGTSRRYRPGVRAEGYKRPARAAVKRWLPLAVHPEHAPPRRAASEKFGHGKVNRLLIPDHAPCLAFRQGEDF